MPFVTSLIGVSMISTHGVECQVKLDFEALKQHNKILDERVLLPCWNASRPPRCPPACTLLLLASPAAQRLAGTLRPNGQSPWLRDSEQGVATGLRSTQVLLFSGIVFGLLFLAFFLTEVLMPPACLPFYALLTKV